VNTQPASENVTNAEFDSAVWAVIPAAGMGSRMGSFTPKQYLHIQGKSLLQHTVETVVNCPGITSVVVALAANDTDWNALDVSRHQQVHTVVGGETRADSVVAALKFVCNKAGDNAMALVHDAARALTSTSDIVALMQAVAAKPEQGGLLAVPVQDTLKRATSVPPDGVQVDSTVSRDNLWQAQTPQMFRAGLLLNALQYNSDAATRGDITDEASAMERMGYSPVMIQSTSPNFKITTSVDLDLASAYLQARAGSQ